MDHRRRALDEPGVVEPLLRSITRERDPRRLLETIVNALVDSGCADACWAVRVSDSTVFDAVRAGEGTREADAQAQLERGELPSLVRRALDARGAIREGSSLVAPLRSEQRVLGALWLVVPPAEAGRSEALEGLTELAIDVACALDRIACEEAARAHARRIEELEDDVRHHRMVVDHVSDVIWSLDLDARRFTYVSPSVERLRGYTPDEVLAQDVDAALTECSRAHLAAVLPDRIARFLAGEDHPCVDRMEQPRKDGSIVRTETVTRLLRDPRSGHLFAYGVSRDLSQHDRAEALTQLYRALSETNELIAREHDERALCQRVCEIVVGLGEIRGVSLSFHEPDRAALVPLAAAGPIVTERALPLEFSLDPSTPNGGSIVVAAFQAGRSVVEHEYAVAPSRRHWRDRPSGVGVRSSAAIPLRRGAEVVAVLAVSAAQPRYFDVERVGLLERMADNLSFGLDRIARARAQADSEARFRTLFELAPIGVAWIDAQSGRILHTNQRWSEILGYDPGELIGRRWQELTHPETLAEDLESHARLLRGEERFIRREKRYFHKDGHPLWVELGIARAWRDGEAATANIVAMTDVSARKHAESALRASEERFRSLLENLTDVVFALDLDGRFTFVSRAVERYGWTPADLLGVDICSLVHPDDRAKVVARRTQFAEGLHPPPLEYRLIDAHGKLRTVRSSSQPLSEGGRVIGVSGVLLDLTQQRDTEDQLRMAQKMEAIGRLAGGVAHDFNNLLSVIRSYADFAIDALRPGDPVRQDLEEVVTAARRAEGLTRQLLAFSRKQVLKPQVLDLDELVARTEKMLCRLLGEDIELRFVAGAPAAPVLADPGQLEQVLMNLAVNARDAMADGGEIAVATTRVELDAREARQLGELEAGAYVRLTVADTGEGMDDTTRARIFEPFFTTKAAGRGTGLGLATVYGIVQQSGGGIAVHSAVGVGTRFEVFLPVAREARSETTTGAPSAERPTGTETVLVVEDEPAVRALAGRILGRAGYHVLTAANAAEAMLACEQHAGAIDLLLTDVVMPGLNGHELAKRLARQRPSMRVLYMSGYADVAFGRGVAAGVELLDKPFSGEELTRRVRAVLDAHA
jgi:PAS domain S-box-containing protein